MSFLSMSIMILNIVYSYISCTLYRCTELAREHQELYQRELVQHGHTMEQLSQYVDKEEERELEVTSIKEEMLKLKEELTVSLVSPR